MRVLVDGVTVRPLVLSQLMSGGTGRPAMTLQLAGSRVLIVEDEQMLAEYLADAMIAAGAEVIGPVATVNAAIDAIANTYLDGATLDIKIRGEMAFPVADALAAP
jgi:ActR/RegA family two-component response regulator